MKEKTINDLQTLLSSEEKRWLDATKTFDPNISQREHKSQSLWYLAARRFFRNKAAMASLILMIVVILFSVIGPYISQYDYDGTDWGYTSGAPSFENGHFFGTDSTGRDIFVRVAIGGRISLLVGIAGALMSVTIGVIYGSISGYIGGVVDVVMMRIIEILSAMPFMFFVILLVTFFGQNIFLIFIAIGAVSWLGMARIVRGQTLTLKKKEFIESALVCGVSTGKIIRSHIIPNLLGLVMVYSSLLVPGMILFESFLSFLGLGVQEPLSSWGSLLNDGIASMEEYPWIIGFPGLFLVVTLFCFNFIGDGLRDAIDPKDVN